MLQLIHWLWLTVSAERASRSVSLFLWLLRRYWLYLCRGGMTSGQFLPHPALDIPSDLHLARIVSLFGRKSRNLSCSPDTIGAAELGMSLWGCKEIKRKEITWSWENNWVERPSQNISIARRPVVSYRWRWRRLTRMLLLMLMKTLMGMALRAGRIVRLRCVQYRPVGAVHCQ